MKNGGGCREELQQLLQVLLLRIYLKQRRCHVISCLKKPKTGRKAYVEGEKFDKKMTENGQGVPIKETLSDSTPNLVGRLVQPGRIASIMPWPQVFLPLKREWLYESQDQTRREASGGNKILLSSFTLTSGGFRVLAEKFLSTSALVTALVARAPRTSLVVCPPLLRGLY